MAKKHLSVRPKIASPFAQEKRKSNQSKAFVRLSGWR
jgi:hypothetical protein